MRACMRLLKIFRADFRASLGYPPYYLAIPTGRRSLFAAFTMHGVLFWGDALSIRTTPAPSTVYYSNGGMEHGTCLVKSTITLTLVPNNQWTPRVGTVWGVGQRGSIYFNVQVPGGRTGHFVYITRGRKCSCDMSRG